MNLDSGRPKPLSIIARNSGSGEVKTCVNKFTQVGIERKKYDGPEKNVQRY